MTLTGQDQIALLLALGVVPIATILTINGRVNAASVTLAVYMVALGYFTWGLA